MLFLVAYACSGAAGLVYEVTWTRLLTLHLGHTTAAGSAVVGAFLLGLAIGAALSGRWARDLTRRQAVTAYAVLEASVGVLALLLPTALALLAPALRWSYADGAAGASFVLMRVGVAVALVLTPALALGATFPLAIRWYASDFAARTRRSAMLYAANTLGAAAGALAAGFVLIPAFGVWRTTLAGVGLGAVSAGLALVVRQRDKAEFELADEGALSPGPSARTRSSKRATPSSGASLDAVTPRRLWLAAGVLALSGFAALLHELAWTRVLALAIGPTTYAFAAALAAVIAGSAAGAWVGTTLVGRLRTPALGLAITLALAAVTAAATYALAGHDVPLYVATQLAAGAGSETWIARGAWITAALVVPTALCLGVAFPLALAVAGATRDDASGRFAVVYALNTAGAVVGSLAAGFVTIPAVGLQATLQIACGCLVLAALVVAMLGGLSATGRLAATVAASAAIVTVGAAPPWDRALMASGAYLYAPFVPEGLDLEAMLKAGQVRFYADGAAATVSVKTLTGTTTLTVDGKTDASNRGDMLTQALVAHVPLLLHPQPRTVAVVGLGSGVTAGAALAHPVERVDVVELSPEVVAASRFFDTENRRALADPRTRLVVGDGRSHLRLSRQAYDVIVSEPSNPWIAGVAALFTREYFAEARVRLAPGGVFCQWANAYNIGEADLRAIAATFLAEFPQASALLVGEYDVLFVGRAAEADGAALWDDVARHWGRAGASEDLARYGATSPFSLLSLVVAGPAELAAFASGARPFDDDTLALEFSAPREIHRRSGSTNGATLQALLGPGDGPGAVRGALDRATAADWRQRGLMLARVDAHARAIGDFGRALALDPDDADALAGLVRSAVLLRRTDEATAMITQAAGSRAPTVPRLVALSTLRAASGQAAEALADARAADALDATRAEGMERVAGLAADAGDRGALAAAVASLEQRFPARAATAYYRAALTFLEDDATGALAHAERALARDPAYAAACDLAGAAAARLGRPDAARAWFERSLAFDAHDSTAYANLGLLALAAGDAGQAASRFAEALWLDPTAVPAREGLARVLAMRR